MRDEICCVYRQLIYLFCRWLIWGERYRPSRMYSEGRETNQTFYGNEILYLRCKRGSLNDEGKKLAPAGIHFPNQSVNRQKYSKPKDVLLPNNEDKTKEWIFWGVARIFVRDIPEGTETQALPTAKKVIYKYDTVHVPEDDNFSHSEIRVKKDGVYVKSQGVKKAYRTDLSFKTTVIVKPLI